MRNLEKAHREDRQGHQDVVGKAKDMLKATCVNIQGHLDKEVRNVRQSRVEAVRKKLRDEQARIQSQLSAAMVAYGH